MTTVAAFRRPDGPDSTPDGELIARTLGGDDSAFAILVGRFQRRIYRVAFAIVRDDLEADGVTQDTFVQAFTHLHRFEGRAEFETWLTRIAINRSRDALRKRKFISIFSGGSSDDELALEIVDERPDPERELAAAELRVAISKAERLLSPQQLTIFRLRHYENLSLEEIAEHLGLRSGTVRAHLFRAIHKVREALSEWRGRTREGKSR